MSPQPGSPIFEGEMGVGAKGREGGTTTKTKTKRKRKEARCERRGEKERENLLWFLTRVDRSRHCLREFRASVSLLSPCSPSFLVRPVQARTAPSTPLKNPLYCGRRDPESPIFALATTGFFNGLLTESVVEEPEQVARSTNTLAFGRRCIPARCVARRSHIS